MSVFQEKEVSFEDAVFGQKYRVKFRPKEDADFEYMLDKNDVPLISASCGCSNVISHPDKTIEVAITIPDPPKHFTSGQIKNAHLNVQATYKLGSGEIKIETLDIKYKTIPKP